MRIAQVAPLHESVPPRLYGGTERVVSYLTEELVLQGHDVTLFASADSQTSARLVPCGDSALRLSGCDDTNVPHLVMLEMVAARADQFDIVHFHTDYLHFPMARRMNVPAVTTLHGRLDLPYLAPLYREFNEMALVSISDSQRKPMPWANWVATIYHGLPEHLYPFQPEPGEYLVFTGRIAPEKRPDLAIEIARRAGMELRIAAKISSVDRPYFEEKIEPLLNQPHVHFVGEVNESQKSKLLGGALAMLFPIDWPEPFGLVMIEAMACGTPVIAFPCGSVPEIIDQGQSGFIVKNVDEAVEAVENVKSLNRADSRACFEKRFAAARMAADYLEVYRGRSRGLMAAGVGNRRGAAHG